MSARRRTKVAFVTEPIEWRSVGDQLPDDDELVLVHCPDSDEPVWPGYWNGTEWLHAEGGPCTPTDWSPMPLGPDWPNKL